jgi:CheY-like chemotaxis protein
MAKILVVDDEADLEMLVKQKFRKKFWKHLWIHFARNVEEALQRCVWTPDLDIILEWH